MTTRLSDLNRLKVAVAKGDGAGKRFGRVKTAVFSPEGTRVVGVMVRRPDIVGMIKRPDVFVALDALERRDKTLVVTNPKEGTDQAAQTRLGLDWNRCIIWSGMDARTESGRELGFVSDASFDATTGQVECFFVGDGGVAQTLVGALPIPAALVRGYAKGYMVVADEVASSELTGGVAAKAGEGYARVKVRGAAAAKKADDKAARALDKGSKTLGRQLGRTKGMFGSFMDEYKRASK